MAEPPKTCGNCGFDGVARVGTNWMWCMACGSLGDISQGDWLAPDPNVVHVPASPTLRRIAAFPPLRVVTPTANPQKNKP